MGTRTRDFKVNETHGDDTGVRCARSASDGRVVSAFTSTHIQVLRCLCTSLGSMSDVESFRCPYPGCGRAFSVNSNMRRHYLSHGVPPLPHFTYLSPRMPPLTANSPNASLSPSPWPSTLSAPSLNTSFVPIQHTPSQNTSARVRIPHSRMALLHLPPPGPCRIPTRSPIGGWDLVRGDLATRRATFEATEGSQTSNTQFDHSSLSKLDFLFKTY
ncbi:hypothetical protein C8R43DRAFT_483626 [Mycena crocata]|nr:hypothetical protein C8R43DRAFT_483626 [Mycena crocata]